jgi:DNA-directed RNA polymerase specialized sigma24 family protein
VFWNHLHQLSDEALLDYYHSTRNIRVFRLLYARHKDKLYRYCSQMNLAAAGSVLEELWKSILERPPQLCGRLLRSWLFIQVNKLLCNATEQNPDTPAETSVPDSKLLAALQKLPRIERNILLLHTECRLPLTTIADIERISLKKCREHYHNGGERLETLLNGSRRQPWRTKEVAV